MPHILNLGAGESPQSPTFLDFLSTIRSAVDAEKLERLHYDASVELGSRSCPDTWRPNPDFHNLTNGQLLEVMRRVVTAIMVILSHVRDSSHDIR